MSIHLSRDLEGLHRDLLSMGSMVEQLVHEAVDSLSHPSHAVAQDLAERDNEIDDWEIRIEDECLKILALHQPVAGDLRRIAVALTINSELERVADLGVHLAERAWGITSGPEIQVPDKLKDMARIAVDMLHHALDAYVELDSSLARRVCASDDQVDEMNREIIGELIGIMQSRTELIPAALHLFSAARHVERVADHATNISENVVFLVEGENIKHKNLSYSRAKEAE